MLIKKLPEKEYYSIYRKVPRLCVDLIIFQGHKILMIEREIDPGRGLWHLPGGTILIGESIEIAAKRIAKEEAGLEINGIELIDVMEFVNESNTFFHTVSQVYTVSDYMGDLVGEKQGKNIKFIDTYPQKMIEEQHTLLNKHFKELLH